MEGKRLIEKIRLLNILSFGERVLEKYRNKPQRNLINRTDLKGELVELYPLNIIIGQNASGKSNFIDVIKLLRSLVLDNGLANFISKSGAINEWIWKGKNHGDKALVEVFSNILKTGKKHNNISVAQIAYEIMFAKGTDQRISIIDEIAKNSDKTISRAKLRSEGKNIKSDESMLISKLSSEDNKLYSEFYFWRTCFHNIIIFTDLNTSRSSKIRNPQVPDAPNDFLDEDGSNLALVLNDLQLKGNTKDKIVENLKKFNPQIKDYTVRILGGTVQLFIKEENLDTQISAMRLSDGTLRYLCLLAILCHPEPPPLICIEEPETGLHPDILPTIAELMKDAATRTQLIVTTHSDILVSAFSDMPEAVLVCEKDEDGTHFKRLDAENLKTWLEEYTLGEVWLRGGIGGTRW